MRIQHAVNDALLSDLIQKHDPFQANWTKRYAHLLRDLRAEAAAESSKDRMRRAITYMSLFKNPHFPTP